MMIPVQAIMVAQFRLVTGLQIAGTYWSVILPGAAAAFGLFLARQFFLSIPQELIEAARMDGAGHLRTFVQIVLPLSKPLIAVLTLLTLLGSWNDFAWPLIALNSSRPTSVPQPRCAILLPPTSTTAAPKHAPQRSAVRHAPAASNQVASAAPSGSATPRSPRCSTRSIA